MSHLSNFKKAIFFSIILTYIGNVSGATYPTLKVNLYTNMVNLTNLDAASVTYLVGADVTTIPLNVLQSSYGITPDGGVYNYQNTSSALSQALQNMLEGCNSRLNVSDSGKILNCGVDVENMSIEQIVKFRTFIGLNLING